jgi:hypothetical protein
LHELFKGRALSIIGKRNFLANLDRCSPVI